MESVDLEVLRRVVSWLREGRLTTLVTIVKTEGPAPRPLGALLAVEGDGESAGSVSGGCVEEDLVERIVRGEFTGSPATVRYGGSEEDERRYKLPCGGAMELVVEPVKSLESLEAVLAAVEQRKLVARSLALRNGEVTVSSAAPGAETLRFDGVALTRVFGPQWRLIVIGAGPASRYLAQMAQALDYHVTICDPRPEYADWTVEGCEFSRAMPDDLVREARPDERSAVVALTHDPRLDDLALIEALKSKAFYVGALGAKANQAKRRERLALFDLTSPQIARLRGPVGLPIGSRTPPELAIAILAELTALRNGLVLLATRERGETPELETRRTQD
jgi:xanthine dehydrogenase accessory factor